MKRLSLSIITLSSFLIAGSAYAKTNITGDIFGQLFGTMNMNDPAIPFSVTIEDLGNPAENCDIAAQTCLLKGVSFSDVVGWTYWDGATMQTEIEAINGPGSFPDEYQAKSTFIGNLSGFAWGEKFGWIQLSACSGISGIDAQATCEGKSYCRWSAGGYCEASANRVPSVASQNINDWGAYIDFCPLRLDQPSCESAESNAYCNWDAGDSTCVFDALTNPNGQPIRGYAWSQYLGWVKFSPEAGDLGFTGALTNWFPDLTPPVPLIPNPDPTAPPGSFWDPSDPNSDPLSLWIPVENEFGIIDWNQFAQDPDSLIDLDLSTITVETDLSPDFTGCPLANDGLDNGNLLMDREPTGEVNFHIPIIGKFISPPPNGFCKFELSGVLYNGSGIGLYFGDEGTDLANAKGINLADPDPNVYSPHNITLYVRAGDLSLTESEITFSGSAFESSIADGEEVITVVFGPKDVAGNLIVPVKTSLSGTLPEPNASLWVRDFALLFDLDSTSNYAFDQLDAARNITFNYPAPILLNISGWGSTPYDYSDVLLYPDTGVLERLDPSGGIHYLDVTGFAPTNMGSPDGLDQLYLAKIDYLVEDQTLPAVSLTQGPWIDTSLLEESFPVNHSFDFQPSLDVTAGSLNSDFIVLDTSLQATFTLTNQSSKPLSTFSVDNLPTFLDDGIVGNELLETKDINLNGLSDTAGRSDPLFANLARYQLFQDESATSTPQINQFHSASQDYHFYSGDFSEDLNSKAEYNLPGDYYVLQSDPCIAAANCPPVPTDRTDALGFNLDANNSDDVIMNFTPSKFIGQAPEGQVKFDLIQYLAYHHDTSIYDQYAIYPATPAIQDYEVKSIGLDTSGLISGGQIYETVGDRDLETISTVSSAELRREIRRNVAVLTRTLEPCNAAATLDQLSAANGGCIAVDSINNTVVAFYEGTPTDTLNLGDGTDLTVPAGFKYTIIIQGGANLNIESNIVYGNANSSFGIILIQNDAGEGANVFVDPLPTNMVGLLYAEGSLLSSPDAGASIYYLDSTADLNELRNQLYWQGSIASRNTIGGGPNRIIPENIDCTVPACAQAYDLDYLRRFTTTDGGSGIYAPTGYKFSGGGSCVAADPANPQCTSPGSLDSTVSITNGFIDPTPTSKSLNTFFIERDNRPVPPGFSSSGGLTSSPVIR